jgi:hypothetical protein
MECLAEQQAGESLVDEYCSVAVVPIEGQQAGLTRL